MWIATALLLSQYRYKMGRMKYFSLLSIPLLYYIFPFENYFGNVFYPLLPSSPLYVSLMYVLIFSATKQVGALVFSLVFWTASSLVYQDRVRKSLLLSSIGIAIFYGSISIAPLSIILFEVFRVKSVWSISVRQPSDEHVIAVPAPGGLLMQKQDAYKTLTKEQERFWKRILIVDNDKDITTTFKAAIEHSNDGNDTSICHI